MTEHLKSAHAVLLASVDESPIARAFTRDEAMALKADIWDAKTKAAHARVQEIEIKQLHDENDKLVGQIVSEEARAVRAEAKLKEIADHIRAWIEDKHNPQRHRERCEMLLKEWGL